MELFRLVGIFWVKIATKLLVEFDSIFFELGHQIIITLYILKEFLKLQLKLERIVKLFNRFGALNVEPEHRVKRTPIWLDFVFESFL